MRIETTRKYFVNDYLALIGSTVVVGNSKIHITSFQLYDQFYKGNSEQRHTSGV